MDPPRHSPGSSRRAEPAAECGDVPCMVRAPGRKPPSGSAGAEAIPGRLPNAAPSAAAEMDPNPPPAPCSPERIPPVTDAGMSPPVWSPPSHTRETPRNGGDGPTGKVRSDGPEIPPRSSGAGPVFDVIVRLFQGTSRSCGNAPQAELAENRQAGVTPQFQERTFTNRHPQAGRGEPRRYGDAPHSRHPGNGYRRFRGFGKGPVGTSPHRQGSGGRTRRRLHRGGDDSNQPPTPCPPETGGIRRPPPDAGLNPRPRAADDPVRRGPARCGDEPY